MIGHTLQLIYLFGAITTLRSWPTAGVSQAGIRRLRLSIHYSDHNAECIYALLLPHIGPIMHTDLVDDIKGLYGPTLFLSIFHKYEGSVRCGLCSWLRGVCATMKVQYQSQLHPSWLIPWGKPQVSQAIENLIGGQHSCTLLSFHAVVGTDLWPEICEILDNFKRVFTYPYITFDSKRQLHLPIPVSANSERFQLWTALILEDSRRL